MPPVLAVRGYASAMASNRFLLYSLASIIGVVTVIANALRIHSNFYALTIHLAKSNGSVIVLANFLVLCAILTGRVWQRVFFGELRTMEVERLYDRIWFFVTESLLAFTIFRDDFDVPFALMFGLLLFTKCFHWLLSDRIEWMDQRPYPGPPLLFHIRINALICILWLTDVITYILILDNLLSNGFSGTILFASEYAILVATLMNSAAKYAITIIDLRRASNRGGENAPPWEDKSMWVFYVELATDFLKLVTYLVFFMVVFAFYGIPLHIIRDVYITARSFYLRFRDLIRYRTATRNMDQRYPNATVEELANMNDRTCIICREEMVSPDLASVSATQNQNDNTANTDTPTPSTTTTDAAAAHPDGPNTTPKRLPCGHVFHFYCLRSWLERQQSCPTCRRSVLDDNQPANGGGIAGRPPAPPQPGAVPQMQNGAPQQQQQRIAGGIVGRVLGMAGMGPIVPGQFANGLLPPPPAQQLPQPPQFINQQQNQLHLALPPQAAPGHPGFGQAHAQGGWGEGVVIPGPAVDRAPEQFNGFWGPDGEWMPWPNDPRQPAVVQQQQQQVETSAPVLPTPASSSSAPIPSPSEVNNNPETLSPSEKNDSAGSSSSVLDATGSQPLPEGSTSPTPTVSARQAAALAAMRRSQSSPGTTTMNSNSSLLKDATSSASVAGAAASDSDGAVGSSDTSNGNSNANSSTTTNQGSNSSRSSSSTSTLPRYIPLYDTTIPTIRVSVPLSTDIRRDQTARRSYMRSRVLDQMANTPTNPHLNTTYQWSTSASNTATPYNVQNVLRSGELPEQLSDEQLAGLDKLTRDAIDERLRILESVSARATMCVEDLLRVRSVLPSLPAASSSTRQGEQEGLAGGAGATQVNGNSTTTANASEAPSATASATTPGEAVGPEVQLEEPPPLLQ